MKSNESEASPWQPSINGVSRSTYREGAVGIRMQVWRSQGLVQLDVMLRKLLWSALYGALAALATIVSRRTATRIWRTLTGEEPPTKK
jgi:hypothetical protein